MRRTPARRLAAWLVTGPVGHLYGGVADVAAWVLRRQWARIRGRSSVS
jgi:hypothetical protein